jgi:EmrB/QacA subfamily drug resistance transporter
MALPARPGSPTFPPTTGSAAPIGNRPQTTTQRIALVASILGSGIVFLDSTIVNVALPAIRTGLGGGLAAQQWVVEAYMLTLSSLLLIGGSLGDLLGRLRVFRAGVISFGAFSLLSAVAPSVGFLIAARALQGAAGALLVPSTLALIMDAFPDQHERAKAIGTWTAWTGVATVIGPLGGGALVQAVSWRWIFAINVAPVLITVALLARLQIGTREPGHIDIRGAVLCAIGLGGPVFALIEQPNYGWTDGRVLIPLIVGILTFGAFLQAERRSPEPMLPLELFASRNFAVGNLTTLALYGGLGVATFFIVVFIQQVAGYSALGAGLSLLPITIVIFALSRRFGALADRCGPHWFMGVGPIVAGCGLLLLTRMGSHAPYASTMLPGVLVFGLGMAATVAPLTATVLGSVDAHRSGIASGVNNALARVASLLAVAAIGAVVSASFAGRLNAEARALPPQTHAFIAAARTKPLVTATPGVSAADRPQLRRALQDASVRAFHIGLIIAAALAILGGVSALVGIENPRRRVASAECPGGALAGASADVASGRLGAGEAAPAPAPAPAAAPP